METPVMILVAEDDPNDVMLLRRAFYKAGVEVPIRFVRDGQEVIDYLEGKPPFDQRAGAAPHQIARLIVGNGIQSRFFEDEIERVDEIGRGIDEGAIEVEGDGRASRHAPSAYNRTG